MISLNAWGQTPAVAKQVRQALRLERRDRAAQRAALRAVRTMARHMTARDTRRTRAWYGMRAAAA